MGDRRGGRRRRWCGGRRTRPTRRPRKPRKRENTKYTKKTFSGFVCFVLSCVSWRSSPVRSVRKPFRFLLGRRDLAARGDDLLLAIERDLRHRNDARDGRRRVVDPELAHQERELPFERLADRAPAIIADAPQLLLERAEGLLPRLVDELLFGVFRLALFDRVLAKPGVHLGLEFGRQLRVLVHHVLEIGRQMDLAGADAREGVERIGRQRRGAVLDRAAEAVFLPRDARELLERVEIDL